MRSTSNYAKCEIPKAQNSSDVGCFRFRSEPHESFWRGEKSVSSRSQPQIWFTRWGRKKNVCNLIFLSSTTWRSWLRLELNINILNVNCLFFCSYNHFFQFLIWLVTSSLYLFHLIWHIIWFAESNNWISNKLYVNVWSGFRALRFDVNFEERKSYISIQFPTIAQSLRIFLIVLEASVLTQVAKRHKNKLYSREGAKIVKTHLNWGSVDSSKSHWEHEVFSIVNMCLRVFMTFWQFRLFLFHFEIRQLEIIASIISIVFEFECRPSKNYLIPSSMAFYTRKCDITLNTSKCAFCQTQPNSLDIFLWVFSVSTFNLSHDRDVNEAGKETMINEKRELWNILFFGLVFQRWDIQRREKESAIMFVNQFLRQWAQNALDMLVIASKLMSIIIVWSELKEASQHTYWILRISHLKYIIYIRPVCRRKENEEEARRYSINRNNIHNYVKNRAWIERWRESESQRGYYYRTHT